MQNFDVIVIGQGYAGLTATKLAVARGLNTASIEAAQFGGLIININELDPVAQDAELSGAELASNLAVSNMDQGANTVFESATAVERGEDGGWVVRTEAGAYGARHVVVASGARLRKLGVPGEEELFGQGVSACADCDGPLFSGMETVVVGGGDSAFQEALTLSQFAAKVTIIMRGAAPRARAELVERANADPKLVQMCNTQVVAVQGSADKGVEAIRIRTKDQDEQTFNTAGVFVFIGLEPNTDFLPKELQRDAAGALITSQQCATALPGLWAIGAVRSGYGGMLTDAAQDAERVIAALS